MIPSQSPCAYRRKLPNRRQSRDFCSQLQTEGNQGIIIYCAMEAVSVFSLSVHQLLSNLDMHYVHPVPVNMS